MMNIDQVLNKYNPEQRELVGQLRIILQSKDLREEIKWGHLTYTGHKPVCSIIPHRDHINLQFFRGAELNDPAGKLEGTGKGMRHIKIRSADDIKFLHLNRLLEDAIWLDENEKNEK